MTDTESESESITFTIVVAAAALVATTVVEISGDDQTATVSTELDDPFIVEVRDQNGDALSGVTVAFAVTAGGGALSSASVTTGSNGRASSTLTLGSAAGTNTVTATVSGITAVTFTATAEAIAVVAYGDYLADESFDITQSIYYAIANTSDRLFALRAAQIDVYTLEGVEQVSERISLHGDNTSGRGLDVYNGFAYVVDITDRQIYVYNISTGARDTTKEFTYASFAGSVQAVVLTDDRVILLDSTDDMLYLFEHDGTRMSNEDIDISFAGQGRGVAINSSSIFVGDSIDGIAYALTLSGAQASDNNVTFDTTDNPSTQGLTASDTHLYSIDSSTDRINAYDITSTSDALVATTLSEVSGDDQSAVVSSALPNPFVVQVNDQNGDAISGETVTFAVTAGGGSLSASSVTTGTNGRAQTTLTLGSTAGTNTVTADVSGISTTITFIATAEALVATSIVRISGNNQSAVVSTELSNPFVVEVRDENDDGYQGATVTFAVTAGGGTLSSTSVTTGTNGRAESTLTLGSTAGTNTVTADVSGISTTITFTATATAEDLVATTLVRLSGNAQTGTVGKELDNPFVAEVRDQNGDGLSGISVSFAVTIGGGTVSAALVTTDSNGQASTTLTLGSTAGSNRVTANVSGITATRNFNATGQATVTTSVVSISGNNQTAFLSTALSNPFIVEVRDQDGDGLSGITVTFAITGGGGTLSATSATTGTNGQASVTLTLGSSTGTNTVTATVSGFTAITFTATASTKPNLAPVVTVNVPRLMEPGESYTITATASDPDDDSLTLTWTVSGGTVADSGFLVTTYTASSTEGVYTITFEADDGRDATAETVYVTVQVEEGRDTPKPVAYVEIQGEDITDRWVKERGLSVGKRLDYPKLSVFKNSAVSFTLNNSDGDFDYNTPNNFFERQSLPAHGRGARVLVSLGLTKNTQMPVFAGQISEVITSLRDTNAQVKVVDLSFKARQNIVEDFGQSVTRIITDLDKVTDDYTETDPILNFPRWGLPISPGSVEAVTIDEDDNETAVTVVDAVATTGMLSNTNAEIDYTDGELRFEAAPDDGVNTIIKATWRIDYQYKRPDTLIRALLEASGLSTEIGITDDDDARFAIEQALLSDDNTETFSSHGRPYIEDNGVMRWIKRDGETWWGIQDARLIKYDAGLDEYENVTTLPTESGLEGVVNVDGLWRAFDRRIVCVA